MKNCISFFQLVVQIVLLFFGWLVVHLLSIRREKAKEKRQLAEKTIALVEDFERAGKNYHTSNERNIESEMAIWHLLHSIERNITRLHLDRNQADRMHTIILRSSIACKNFGPDFEKKQELDSKIIMNIEGAAGEMIDFIDARIIQIA